MTLQGPTTTEKGKYRADYIWGASIVEVILKLTIELWELRNEEVHGKTNEQQQRRRKERLCIEVRALHAMKDKVRPSDSYLFHPDVEEYLEAATASTIANYIVSHRKYILGSVDKWAKKAADKTRSILNWFVPKLDGGIERLHKTQRDKFIHDAYNKKKRRKQKAVTCNLTQSSISAFVTLNQNLY